MNSLLKSFGTLTTVAASTEQPVMRETHSLDQLTAKFRTAHGKIASGIRMSDMAQIECGTLLEQMRSIIKEKGGLGYWTAWVELNCGVTLRQVQRYMKRAAEFRKLSETFGSEATAMSLLAQGSLQKLTSDPNRTRQKVRGRREKAARS